MSACNCRAEADKALGKHNSRIKHYFTLRDNRVGMPWPIETEQVEKGRGKRKAMGLFASFCPLCGASLKPAEAST